MLLLLLAGWRKCKELQEKIDSSMHHAWWQRILKEQLRNTQRDEVILETSKGFRLDDIIQRLTICCYSVENSRHFSGKWLHRTIKGDHCCVLRIRSPQVKRQTPNLNSKNWKVMSKIVCQSAKPQLMAKFKSLKEIVRKKTLIEREFD